MLKFLRKYKQYIMVVAGVLLMVAFLVPSAIQEWGTQQGNVTVMRIGQRKVSALEHHVLTMEYEVLNRLSGGSLPRFGITDGPEQWILLVELADRAGFIGAPMPGDQVLDDIGRMYADTKLRTMYPPELLNNPQFASFVAPQVQQDVESVKINAPRVQAEARLTDAQMEEAYANFRGVQRYLMAYTGAARVSAPRAILRGERELEGAQVEYVFYSADRRLAEVPEPDQAALETLLNTYKDTRPGEGAYGLGYLLPPRIKLEYLVLDYAKIAAKVTPDLKEVRRRYNALVAPEKSFEEARAGIEAEVRHEMVEKAMNAAGAVISGRIANATRMLPEEGPFKVLPADWSQTRPTLASLVDDVVKGVEEKTSPEPGKPGIRIDPPEVVVRDDAFLTRDDLAALQGIGNSSIQRGQRAIPFPDYALGVRELVPNTPIALQVGLPSQEPSRSADGSRFFFTVLDTREESSPRSVDEVRARLVSDWKRVEAYKLLAQDVDALRQKAIAEGIASLDDSKNTPVEPGKPAPPSMVRNGRVTRTAVNNGDPDVNIDTFRLAVMDAADKLDPLVASETYPADQRIVAVALPDQLGVSVARIRSLAPLTVEDVRARQAALVNAVQLDEFRGLETNPLSLDKLRQRLNVRYIGRDGEERTESESDAG